MNTDFNVTCGELELKSPFLTGSGTFGYGDEFSSLINYSYLGGIVAKSISPETRSGNKPPRICETSGGIINSIGLANPGVDRFIAEKVPTLPIEKTKVFLSIVGNTVEDFVSVAIKFDRIPNISGYELNVSCPNVKKGGLDLGGDKTAVSEIVKEVRAATKRFISVKLTPNQPAIAPMAEAAVKAGADCLTLVNTLIGMAIDVEKRTPLLGNIIGGFSGPPLKPVALAKVWQAAQAVDAPIWASGGMVCGKDCIEFLLAGATGLQLGSVLFADPYAPERITNEISVYCQRHGIKAVRDLIGALNV